MQRMVAALVSCLATGLLASGARAQVLTFDDVCASPPCVIGTLYAAQGITFAPSTVSIVATGTNGLTGPSGERYLAMSGPFTLTLSFARQATLFSARVSRGAASTNALTLNVTFYRDAAVVGSRVVALDVVDEWSTILYTNAAGFDEVVLSPVGGLNRQFGIDGVQVGGNCNGFADVQSGDVFCNAAEWLANRGVTLGCSPGLYCPSDNVTRAQMALFMQRLGDAVAPMFLSTFEVVTDFSTESSHFDCVTEPVDIAVPMTALMLGGFNFQPTSGPWRALIRNAYTQDDGTGWRIFSQTGRQVAATGEYADVTMQDVATVGPGRVSFALQIARDAGGGNLSQGRCRLIVQLTGARGAGLPAFDGSTDHGPAAPGAR